MTGPPAEVTQQLGPSTQMGRSDNSNEDVPGRADGSSEIAELRRQIEELREQLRDSNNRSPDPRSEASFVSRGSGFTALEQAGSNKLLHAVSSLMPPGGLAWQGSADKRSAKRFLSLCGSVATSNGLDAEGLVRYSLNRCVDAEMRDELNDECLDLFSLRPIDYRAIVTRIETYFNERYHGSNGTDRAVERIESGRWAHGVRDIEEYIRQFRAACKDCSMVGVPMDERLKRRYFVKHLPDRIKEFVEDRYEENAPVSDLERAVSFWIERKGVNYFRQVRSPVKAAAGVESPEPRFRKEYKCFKCGEMGHFARDCKKRQEVRAVQSGSDSGNLVWTPASVVSIGRVAYKPYDCVPMIEVKVQSIGAGVGCQVSALVDSGASRTLCSRRMADALNKMQAILACDVESVSSLEMKFADGSYGRDIGNVRALVDGVHATIHVVNSLSPDMIVGTDLIGRHEGARNRLMEFIGVDSHVVVAKVTDEVPESAGNAVNGEPSPQVGSAIAPKHALWPAINLK